MIPITHLESEAVLSTQKSVFVKGERPTINKRVEHQVESSEP